jgi:hypothetical protein
VSEKVSEASEMSASAEASQLVRRCAEPVSAGESVKALINKAARRTGLSASRVKGLWYAEARSVLAEEMDRLRAAAKRERALEDDARRDAALRNEYREVSERLERMEARLEQIASRMEG